MEHEIKTLIPEEEVEKKIVELAERISRDYEGKTIHVVGILRGAVFFMTELCKHVTVPVKCDFIRASSYGSGSVSSGDVKVLRQMDETLEGQDVLIVEDILDTGYTLTKLKDIFMSEKPASLKIAVLLDKTERRKVPIEADYCGFVVPDKFIVGYGLDYDQQYRNLPYIGEIKDV